MKTSEEILKLQNQLCFPIYLCAKEMTRKYNQILKNFDLTYTQYIVMMYFWEVKTSNVKNLGKVLLLDSSTLTPLLKKLEQKGYILRKKRESDERNLVIELTRKGEALKNKIKSVPLKMGNCVNLEENEAKQMVLLAYKILENLRKDEE
ncbi:MAG: MarR family transcriptional regulator [Bacilli bacterium]|nr:MarR family transcriptional regulator [Bacilli bacterium]MBR1817886.1 MarR family transcriptional regulator [Bacilli bacterium]